jgi:dTDP-4-dehydrorhamnose 3,5-epimerase-like enzyme
MPVPGALATIGQLRMGELPTHRGPDGGEITVMETGAAVPFVIGRAFSTRGPKGLVRGRHAHRRCTQLMIATSGTIDIRCDDGANRASYQLDRADCGLLVPPGIWAEIEMTTDHAGLLVLCDRGYEAEDYIRDYQEFLAYRRRTSAPVEQQTGGS